VNWRGASSGGPQTARTPCQNGTASATKPGAGRATSDRRPATLAGWLSMKGSAAYSGKPEDDLRGAKTDRRERNSVIREDK
jgi:hypothetical protein